MGRLFGTDGIRGVVGEELTTHLARRVGLALVNILNKEGIDRPRVIVGMDTRLSSDMLAAAVMEGICDGGGDAATIGVCSTPAVAHLLLKHSFDAGVMISASHNPWQYNGIKIFAGDGFKLDDRLEGEMEELILDREPSPAPERGKMTAHNGGVEEYVSFICNCCDIPLKGLRVGIDCANGSASATAEKIFSRLGAECHMLCDCPDGMNINEGCGSTHLDGLRRQVLAKGLDLGIAFDGDADRCLAIDELGNDVDGDHILAILSSKLMSEGGMNKNKLVGTVMSNLGLIKFCEENGIDFYAAKVGDRYVLERLNEEGLSLGGEQSGHIILRSLSTTGDGQLTATLLLSYMKKSGKSLSALAGVMKKCPQFMINVPADAKGKAALSSDGELINIIKEAEERMGNNGRILIRPSGTEHLIRVMTEGVDPTLAEETCKELSARIEKRLSEL